MASLGFQRSRTILLRGGTRRTLGVSVASLRDGITPRRMRSNDSLDSLTCRAPGAPGAVAGAAAAAEEEV